MITTYRNLKYELILSNEQSVTIDYVSSCLRQHYNSLLAVCIDDYTNNNNSLNLMSGYNLRNYSCNIQKKDDECLNFHTPLVKNTALRLKETFNGLFKFNRGFPKFKSYYGDWFSLYYEEKATMPSFNKKNGLLLIKLGKDVDGYKLNFECRVKGLKQLPNKVKTARIIKDKVLNKYYIIFTCLYYINDVPNDCDKWISIDQNHKNMFMAIDYNGKSLNMRKSLGSVFFNKQIDFLKSKRDKLTKNSRRYNKLNYTIKKYYHKRDEQIKKECYTIANFLNKNYNHIIIGDYTPSASQNKNINKTIITNSLVGKVRQTIGEVAERYSNRYEVVDEAFTTMTCCLTDIKTKRTTDERDWYVNDTLVLRDLNSAVNIVKKSSIGYEITVSDLNISSIDLDIHFRYDKGLVFNQ